MKKSELKAIIKQCIVEVLTEGLGDDVATTIAEHKRTLPRNGQSDAPRGPKKSVLRPDLVAAMAPDIKAVAAGNSIMESLLADTAKNSLQGMMASDNLLGSNDEDAYGNPQVSENPLLPQEARIMSGLNPEDLFGSDTMERMARLAMPKRLP
jgi:hypothetical protein